MAARVSVFGLGYVGCVSAACLSESGNEIVGVDVNATKVAMVNAGTSPIVEERVGELFARAARAGRLRATTSVAEAIHQTSVSLVCVGTPSRHNGAIDLSHITRVCEEIGGALRTKDTWHTVAFRSTMIPGTTECLLTGLLETASGKEAGVDFGIVMNPEFLREGTAVRDFRQPPFTLVGTVHERSAEVMRDLYADVDAPLHVAPPRVAEMVKYASNCYHAVKVTFANEIGNICKALEVDSHDVMRLFCLDTKLNVSASYLKPGFAFGGSCLPKDLRAIVHQARHLDIDAPLLSATLESNRRQVVRAYEMIVGTGSKRVGVLGLAFKAGTDDLRESPIVSLVEMLHGRGLRVSVYDREVSRARIIGANKEYIEREIPHIWSMMRERVNDVLDECDVVVIGNSADEFRSIGDRLRRDQLVIDLVRVADRATLIEDAAYEGIAW